MNAEKIIPIVVSFDKNYIPYAKVAINSILSKCSSKIKLYCFGLDLDENDFDYFRDLMLKHGGFFEGVHFNSGQLLEFDGTIYITKATYLRIFIPNFVKESKVIYVDCDTLFFQDITELYDISLEGNAIMGAEDWSSMNLSISEFNRVEKLELPKDECYINCGIIVLDTDYLRRIDFVKLCHEINIKYKDRLKYVDQCIINKALEGKKKIMSLGWNFQFLASYQSLSHILPMPAVHSIGENKIWMTSKAEPLNHDIWVSGALSCGLTKEEIGIRL